MNVSFIRFDLASAFKNSDQKNENVFKNLSKFIVNSEIKFDLNENDTIQIDRQDNSKTHSNTLRESDLNTNGFVCMRRDNKIGIKCIVTPLSEYVTSEDNKKPLKINVAFGIKHCLDQKAISDSSTTVQQQQQQQPLQLLNKNSTVQKVFISF